MGPAIPDPLLLLALGGTASFTLVALIVGTRLLLLARRTREVPELCIGVALLTIGPFGHTLVVAVRSVDFLPPGWVVAATLAGLAGTSIASGALYVFIWRVFHPADGWARAGGYLGFVLLSISSMGDGVTRVLVSLEGAGFWLWLAFATRTAPLAWASFESFRHAVRLRRRSRLGLADPLATRAAMLWGSGAAFATAAFAVSIATRALTGVSISRVPAMNVPLAVLALAGAISMWMAFFPTKSIVAAAGLRKRAAAS